MLFWGLTIGLAALAALPIIAALLRGGEGTEARHDMAIYRDQLAEIDRDLARGTLTEEEAARVRLEVQRRILEADRNAARRLGRAPGALTGAAVVIVSMGVIGGGLGLYAWLGAPGYPDLPLTARIEQAEQARADRPSQADAERQAAPALPRPETGNAEFTDLMERLRATLETRPDDLEGHLLLARNEAAMGNFAAARAAQARAVEIAGEDAGAEAVSTLAELMILAAGGFVTNEAEAMLDRTLAMDPENGSTRYYKGLAAAQVGRPDIAFRTWRDLVETSAPGAPWVEPIRTQIGAIAQRAGIRYTPPAPAGPDAEAIANAADMSETERQQMIEGMVAGLSERLATEGGPPADWARLIAAYGVLGRTDRADAIWKEAQELFGGTEEAIAPIREAAVRAGLVE